MNQDKQKYSIPKQFEPYINFVCSKENNKKIDEVYASTSSKVDYSEGFSKFS